MRWNQNVTEPAVTLNIILFWIDSCNLTDLFGITINCMQECRSIIIMFYYNRQYYVSKHTPLILWHITKGLEMNGKHFSNELEIFEATRGKTKNIKLLFNSLKTIPPTFVE